MAREYNLRTDAIGVVPVPYSWDGEKLGEDWEIIYPNPEAWPEKYRRQWWGEHFNNEPPEDAAAFMDALREAIAEQEDWAPMMGYYYPLPEFHGDRAMAQSRLEELGVGACSIVEVEGEPVLCLTGGGMDLSWDICRAYIALGYFPPAHFAGKLPRQGEIDTYTARVCVESCRIAARWAKHNVDDAARTLAATLAAKRERKAGAKA